jgi:hypothetical protein
MSAETKVVKVIRVNIEHDPAGLFYATSPDLKGLLVAENSEQAVIEAVPEAISGLYTAMGVSVVIFPAGDLDGDHPMKTWVGVPSGLTEKLEGVCS